MSTKTLSMGLTVSWVTGCEHRLFSADTCILPNQHSNYGTLIENYIYIICQNLANNISWNLMHHCKERSSLHTCFSGWLLGNASTVITFTLTSNERARQRWYACCWPSVILRQSLLFITFHQSKRTLGAAAEAHQTWVCAVKCQLLFTLILCPQRPLWVITKLATMAATLANVMVRFER